MILSHLCMSKNYKYLLIAGMLCNLGDNMIGPFYSIYIRDIGIKLTDIGYSSVIFNFALAFLMFYVGKKSDKLNKKWITVLGYGLSALGSLSYLFISKPWHLFSLQILFAISMACLSAPLSALYAEHIQKDKSGEQWGFLSGSGRVAVGLAVLAGTFIVNYLGFTVLFLTMFTIQCCVVFVQAFLFKPEPKPKIISS